MNSDLLEGINRGEEKSHLVTAGGFGVSLKTEAVRDESWGKPSNPVEVWVNSANAGFKVAELLPKMNSRVLIFSLVS